MENDCDKWLASVNEGRKPISILTAPPPLSRLMKAIAEGFDLGRIHLGRIDSEFGKPVGTLLAPILEQWERSGLVVLDGQWVEPTLAGQFWHVNLAQLSIDYLTRSLSEEAVH